MSISLSHHRRTIWESATENIPTARIEKHICDGAANGRSKFDDVLKSSGSFFLNIGAAPSNPMLPHEIV